MYFVLFFEAKGGGDERFVGFRLLIVSSDNNSNDYWIFLGVAKIFEALSFFG
jgi:hypothetical protein